MSASKPLVSVVVPVYNIAGYVEKCLDSVISQTYNKLEIIVVDDGSSDSSGKICDEFGKRDLRIKVFHTKNRGLSAARNLGIKKATGEYISLVDGDDFIDRDFIATLVAAALKEQADIVVCGYNEIVPERKVVSGEEATLELLLRQNNLEIVAWNKLYRRELFIHNQIFYPEGYKNEDALTTYKLLAAARRVAYVDASLYSYVERNTSIMKNQKLENRLTMREKAAREAVQYFRDNLRLKAEKETIRYFCDNLRLKSAAEISMLTAKLAWIDFAITRKIDAKKGDLAREWILENYDNLIKNQFLSSKLRMYLYMLKMLNGKPYVWFRKFRHE